MLVETAAGCRGVELLGHRDKGDTVFIEQLHELQEVEYSAAEAVRPVDEDALNSSGADLLEQVLESGSSEVAA